MRYEMVGSKVSGKVMKRASTGFPVSNLREASQDEEEAFRCGIQHGIALVKQAIDRVTCKDKTGG